MLTERIRQMMTEERDRLQRELAAVDTLLSTGIDSVSEPEAPKKRKKRTAKKVLGPKRHKWTTAEKDSIRRRMRKYWRQRKGIKAVHKKPSVQKPAPLLPVAGGHA